MNKKTSKQDEDNIAHQTATKKSKQKSQNKNKISSKNKRKSIEKQNKNKQVLLKLKKSKEPSQTDQKNKSKEKSKLKNSQNVKKKYSQSQNQYSKKLRNSKQKLNKNDAKQNALKNSKKYLQKTKQKTHLKSNLKQNKRKCKDQQSSSQSLQSQPSKNDQSSFDKSQSKLRKRNHKGQTLKTVENIKKNKKHKIQKCSQKKQQKVLTRKRRFSSARLIQKKSESQDQNKSNQSQKQFKKDKSEDEKNSKQNIKLRTRYKGQKKNIFYNFTQQYDFYNNENEQNYIGQHQKKRIDKRGRRYRNQKNNEINQENINDQNKQKDKYQNKSVNESLECEQVEKNNPIYQEKMRQQQLLKYNRLNRIFRKVPKVQLQNTIIEADLINFSFQSFMLSGFKMNELQPNQQEINLQNNNQQDNILQQQEIRVQLKSQQKNKQADSNLNKQNQVVSQEKKKVNVLNTQPFDIIHCSLPLQMLYQMPQVSNPVLQKRGFIFVWAQKGQIQLAYHLLNRWGFDVIDQIVWIKTDQNMAKINDIQNRQQNTFTNSPSFFINCKSTCLVGYKSLAGHKVDYCTKISNNLIFSSFVQNYRKYKTQNNSNILTGIQKPIQIYEIADLMMPGSRRLQIGGDMYNRNQNMYLSSNFNNINKDEIKKQRQKRGWFIIRHKQKKDCLRRCHFCLRNDDQIYIIYEKQNSLHDSDNTSILDFIKIVCKKCYYESHVQFLSKDSENQYDISKENKSSQVKQQIKKEQQKDDIPQKIKKIKNKKKDFNKLQNTDEIKQTQQLQKDKQIQFQNAKIENTKKIKTQQEKLLQMQKQSGNPIILKLHPKKIIPLNIHQHSKILSQISCSICQTKIFIKKKYQSLNAQENIIFKDTECLKIQNNIYCLQCLVKNYLFFYQKQNLSEKITIISTISTKLSFPFLNTREISLIIKTKTIFPSTNINTKSLIRCSSKNCNKKVLKAIYYQCTVCKGHYLCQQCFWQTQNYVNQSENVQNNFTQNEAKKIQENKKDKNLKNSHQEMILNDKNQNDDQLQQKRQQVNERIQKQISEQNKVYQNNKYQQYRKNNLIQQHQWKLKIIINNPQIRMICFNCEQQCKIPYYCCQTCQNWFWCGKCQQKEYPNYAHYNNNKHKLTLII